MLCICTEHEMNMNRTCSGAMLYGPSSLGYMKSSNIRLKIKCLQQGRQFRKYLGGGGKHMQAWGGGAKGFGLGVVEGMASSISEFEIFDDGLMKIHLQFHIY